MRNPYEIETPAVISFSGGRSSGFMLWNIIQAYGGTLPEDIKVIFCNTGLEHYETYEFIHRIEQEWCPVIWLEYDERKVTKEVQRDDGLDVVTVTKAHHKQVDYYTASRSGEPFEQVINYKSYLPNPVTRFCTQELKIKLSDRFMKEISEEYTNCVGLRADEQKRVSRLKGRKVRVKLDVCAPMAEAGHTREDVMDFWNGHPLDLKLPLDSNIFGNCVGCFLKGYSKLEAIAEKEPEQMDFWIRMEEKTGNTFRIDRPKYFAIKRDAHKQLAFDFGDTIDCFCTD